MDLVVDAAVAGNWYEARGLQSRVLLALLCSLQAGGGGGC